MRRGFEKDHVPVRKVPRTTKGGPIIINFPSRKITEPFLRIRGRLMRDTLIHFETNWEIEKISSFPVELVYPSYDDLGFVKKRKHAPQIGVQYRRRGRENMGRIVYMDVIPLQFQKRLPFLDKRTAELQRSFSDIMNSEYNVLDERSVHIDPIMSNVRLQFRHLFSRDAVAINRVMEVLDDLQLPTDIGTVRTAAAIPNFWHEIVKDDYLAQQEELWQIDRAFTAIMELSVRGDIEIDLSEPISDSTLVWWNPAMGELK